MSDNLKRILDEFERLKGQFVITESNTVERLVAIGDDGDDWYYVTINGRKLSLHWSSCVGRVLPLMGFIENEDYNYLVSCAKLNHFDQITDKVTFEYELKNYLAQYPTDKIITDFCWDLKEV